MNGGNPPEPQPPVGRAPSPAIAVVIPCYRVGHRVLEVLAALGPEVARIYVVDDACPDGTGPQVEARCRDPRVRVLRSGVNRGVGAATIAGFQEAVADRMDVLVKIDGDGQMDPALIPRFAAPILNGEADYSKGNRFFTLESVAAMPPLRIVGNAVLSFLTKLSTGYWGLFDPTNGFIAIHARVFTLLPANKLSPRFFFESDMLFRLNTVGAVVTEIPMLARYAGERSSLRIARAVPEFLFHHLRNTAKRIFYNYYLRNFNIASVNLLVGTLLVLFGGAFGAYHWQLSRSSGVAATSGTVMVATLPIVIGVELLLAFLSFDMGSKTTAALHKRLGDELTHASKRPGS